MATVQKRGETYRIRCSLGYDANGKQVIKSMTYKPEQGLTSGRYKKNWNSYKSALSISVKQGKLQMAKKLNCQNFVRNIWT